MNWAAALTVVSVIAGFTLIFVGAEWLVYGKPWAGKVSITLFIITVITGALAAGLGIR